MEVRWDILLIILGAALVTFVPRVLPLMLLSRIALPEWGVRWLNHVPIAVMAALIGQEIFLRDGKWSPFTSNIELLAALPSFLVAIKTRSLLGTVIVGIVTVMALRFWFI
ncbi:branched-chain amino acid ABC transporter [Brevibacillus panacihumi W25]|uniref:Branched-chain amino acid ABC transporter n=1 Tax=Brevibacillus panacihumi W25 TaxID=1408254 RepID=V6LZB6_9BACL|nr:AzlD domain-containing protein [Brevibacillus panacihumi]EST51811.1 branched-chain amino acid ABC transporter [Brevibacillus panacihumi W25]